MFSIYTVYILIDNKRKRGQKSKDERRNRNGEQTQKENVSGD